ncbi:MAG: hypothetical protein KGL29_08505 [Alphaproteobacteria bacterium]|nr:hypothetical protein [Alphaproteobacteria bacterium]MDE2265926.1 hypothetical protein [Alphaproteobacteria bacterium]
MIRANSVIVFVSAAIVLFLWTPSYAQNSMRTCGDRLSEMVHAQRGMTITSTPDQPVCLETRDLLYGGAATGPSTRIDAVFVQSGGHPCQYTVGWDSPVTEVRFTRSALKAGPSGVTHPVWQATAYDSAGRQVATVGEAEIRSYSDVPSRAFTLDGSGITHVVFWGDDRGVDGFCNVVLDSIDFAH